MKLFQHLSASLLNSTPQDNPGLLFINNLIGQINYFSKPAHTPIPDTPLIFVNMIYTNTEALVYMQTRFTISVMLFTAWHGSTIRII